MHLSLQVEQQTSMCTHVSDTYISLDIFFLRCVKVWSLATYKPLASLPHSGCLTSLLISNLLLVSACQSSTVQLWSMEGLCTQPSNSRRAVSHPEEESPRPFPITHWQLENELYFTDMLLDGDKIFACGR